MTVRRSILLLCLAAGGLIALAAPSPAYALPREVIDVQGGGPDELQGVGIEEKLNGRIPFDAEFTNEAGEKVLFGRYFGKDRPIVLQIGYFECPMLCGLVNNAMLDAMNGVTLSAGKDYDVIYLSVNPRENHVLAAQKKQNMLTVYDRAGAAEGIHLLTGSEADIRKVTQAVGFNYKWSDSARQYLHAAAIMIITPDGRMSRYLVGLQYEPRTLRLALVEGSEGKIGTTSDHLALMFCNFSAEKGGYVLAARGVMKIGGLLTVLILGTVLVRLFLREARRRALPSTGDAGRSGPDAASARTHS